ncbi:hypothetical protein [Aestuariivirga sp.]|uniref:hypothetical protein n=1 Tax=Aestuariivirga sp. TaxID=2650926 RepID=UPI0039194077
MKHPMIAVVLLALPVLTTGSQAQDVTAEQCQPLSEQNRAQCCNAPNWRDIVLPEFQGMCSNDNTSTQQQSTDDAVGSVTSPDDDGNGLPGTPDGGGTDSGGGTGSAQGNPGNSNAVGNAGEKGMDNESPSSGTEGNSN